MTSPFNTSLEDLGQWIESAGWDPIYTEWAVGTHYGVNVIARHPSGNREKDVVLMQCQHRDIAAKVVRDHNALIEMDREARRRYDASPRGSRPDTP
jgi:hypothetical protein